MSTVFSFPPIASPNARVLILGSMPGLASLQAGQYYAHPRNQFWAILAALLGRESWQDYAEKRLALLDAHIALWDVLQSCRRPGSLDADIAKPSMVVNDFAGFLTEHPQIRHVFFNGTTAEQTFRRAVLPALSLTELRLQRLPSTSPAHAALNFQQKLQQWQTVTAALQIPGDTGAARNRP